MKLNESEIPDRMGGERKETERIQSGAPPTSREAEVRQSDWRTSRFVGHCVVGEVWPVSFFFVLVENEDCVLGI